MGMIVFSWQYGAAKSGKSRNHHRSPHVVDLHSATCVSIRDTGEVARNMRLSE